MNEAQPVDRERPSRRPAARLALGLLAFGAALSGAPPDAKTLPGAVFAGAPPVLSTTTDPLTPRTPGGVHYQVLSELPTVPAEQPTEASPGAVAIFLPRPPFDEWETVSVTSDAPCLELGPLDDPGPGYVLVQTAVVAGDLMSAADGGAAATASGMSCDAVLDVSFVAEQATWQTSLSVHLFRPLAEPYRGDDFTASLSVSRLATAATAPGAAGQRVLLLEVTVSNLTSEPIELLGLIDQSGIKGASGEVYRIPAGRFLGTVRELQELTGSTQGIEIAAADHARLGLVFDAEAHLARTGGTLTAQPAVLVRDGTGTYSLSLNRVSTAWGDDLP